MVRIAGFGLPLALLLALLCPAVSAQSTDDVAKTQNASGDATSDRAPEIPKDRLYLSSLSVVRINPVALETQARLVFQRRLGESDKVLFNDTFMNGGLSLKLNPAFMKIGPVVELQPIALFNLRLTYEFLRYFGAFGYLQSWPEPTSAYPVTDADRRAIADTAYKASGQHLVVEPALQAKFGPIAVRSRFGVEYWKIFDLREGDRVIYDATLDTLIPADGLVMTNDTAVLYLGGRLNLGLVYSMVKPFFDASDFQGGVVPEGNPSYSQHRIGPIITYSFNTREYTRWSRPTLALVTGYYLKHEFRYGGFPYVLFAFTFNSDLLRPR